MRSKFTWREKNKMDHSIISVLLMVCDQKIIIHFTSWKCKAENKKQTQKQKQIAKWKSLNTHL